MARLGRAEVFSPDEIAICHVMSRVVRRCFLLGDDPVSGKNFDHRKLWIEEQLTRLSTCFGIDLLCFSILSNHFHLVLRSRPDVVAMWDDTQVARRWLMLCPIRKDGSGRAMEPSEPELNSIRHDPQKLALIRLRLSDISWWMRLLCQNIGRRANTEDEQLGKFFQGRYRAVRLLDDAAILACAAYVDLNPIRAALAQTLEQSDHTSVQRRIEALQCAVSAVEDSVASAADQLGAEPSSTTERALPQPTAEVRRPDQMLSPVEIDELRDELGSRPSSTPGRCSDKGFLNISAVEYVELLDWTARQTAPGKLGTTPADAPPILERLWLQPDTWRGLVSNFGRLFHTVAGRAQTIDACRTGRRRRRHRMRREARELLSV